MERGDSNKRPKPPSSSALKMLQASYSMTSRSVKTNAGKPNVDATVSANMGSVGAAATATRENRPAPPSTVREQDQYMPIANVIRIMRRILPPHAKISDDAKETIQECVSEFISFITGEANDRCQREQRKTITAEDVLWAMGKLGFDDYIDPLNAYLNRYRDVETDRSSTRGEPYPKRGGPVGPEYMPLGIPNYGPVFPAGYHNQGLFDVGAMAAFYRDANGGGGGGGSSSYPAMHNFDPYAQFK